jgi:hypothetical protein
MLWAWSRKRLVDERGENWESGLSRIEPNIITAGLEL